jgi:hypothetical protein
MKKLAFFIISLFSAAVFSQNSSDAIVGQELPDPAVSQGLPDTAVSQELPYPTAGQDLTDVADSQELPANTELDTPDTAVSHAQPKPAAAPKPPDTTAQPLPNIAVYVTGDFHENEKKALGTHILAALVNSGRYKGIERSSSFLAEIDKEMETQMSGSVDDAQISKVGIQFGVKFICIADITPALGGFQVSARIVNVETAEVAFIGQATSPLKTIDDLTKVSDRVARRMFGEPEPPEEPAAPPRKPKTGMSMGAGGFWTSGFGGGIAWSNGERVAMPYSGGGAYLFFDAKYAEAFAGYSTDGGKWKSKDIPDADKLPDMRRTYAHGGLFVKYPMGWERVKYFPLLGVEYEYSNSGELKYEYRSDYVFDGKNNRPAAKSLSALWFKFGGGVDFGLGESVYIRAEFLYGLRTANTFEKDFADNNYIDDVSGNAGLGHGLILKIGVGVKF